MAIDLNRLSPFAVSFLPSLLFPLAWPTPTSSPMPWQRHSHASDPVNTNSAGTLWCPGRHTSRSTWSLLPSTWETNLIFTLENQRMILPIRFFLIFYLLLKAKSFHQTRHFLWRTQLFQIFWNISLTHSWQIWMSEDLFSKPHKIPANKTGHKSSFGWIAVIRKY